MNERIQQLAEQAGALVVKNVTNIPKAFSLNGEEIEKFAELIIRECAEACYRHENVEAFGIYSMRVLQVSMACERNILQHFGVTDE